MENKFEEVLNPETLTEVLPHLSLSELRKIVTAKPRRGTDFIEITTKHPDRTQAAFISNQIARAYIKRRAKRETERASAAREALDKELARQQLLADSFVKDSVDHQEALNMLREMEIKQQDSRKLLKQPRTPVTIHQLAE